MLGGKEAPTIWDIHALFEDEDNAQIAEQLACYFNKISTEFEPLEVINKEIRLGSREPPEIYQVAVKLRSFRKPNSTVKGDIPPSLINEVSDILAIPLHFIYCQVYDQLEWPDLWKAETVNVIPKNSAPSDFSQLRNISCTPLFSKFLETFVLDGLKEEVKLTNDQYGGIKGLSVNHFLIGMHERPQ